MKIKVAETIIEESTIESLVSADTKLKDRTLILNNVPTNSFTTTSIISCPVLNVGSDSLIIEMTLE
jgi:hypothetical protein